MTIKEIRTLPLGTGLWFTEGKTLAMPCYLARIERNSYGKVLVASHKLEKKGLGYSWFAHPRQLRLMREYSHDELAAVGIGQAAE